MKQLVFPCSDFLLSLAKRQQHTHSIQFFVPVFSRLFKVFSIFFKGFSIFSRCFSDVFKVALPHDLPKAAPWRPEWTRTPLKNLKKH